MDLQELTNRAIEIRNKYKEFEKQRYGKSWTTEHVAEGLVGDIGDLMKLIMAKEGMRETKDIDQKLAHELADCLWSLLIIASEYNVNLEQFFLKTMNEVEVKIAS